MKCSEIIALLQAEIAKHGDLEILIDDGSSIGEATPPEYVSRFTPGTSYDDWHRWALGDPPQPVIVMGFGANRNYGARL